MFYGRTDEIAKINKILEDGECLYINGPNGIGKTELMKYLMGNEDKNPWCEKETICEPAPNRVIYKPGLEDKRVVVSVRSIDSGMDGIIRSLTQAGGIKNKSEVKELREKINNMFIRKPIDIASDIIDLYSDLGIEQLILFVDEFEGIVTLEDKKESNSSTTKKEDVEQFLTNLKILGNENDIKVSIVIASRKSFEVLYDKDNSFRRNFSSLTLGGFSDQDLNKIFRNEYKDFRPEVKREVYFYCGRHPGLLKMMRAKMTEKMTVETVENLIRKDSKDLIDVYETCYDKMSEVRGDGEYGLLDKFLVLFDCAESERETKEQYRQQLLWQGFIVKGSDKPYFETNQGKNFFGEVSEEYISRNKRYEEFEPITPYMYEYIKTKKEREESNGVVIIKKEGISSENIPWEDDILPAEKKITLTEEELNARLEEKYEAGYYKGYAVGTEIEYKKIYEINKGILNPVGVLVQENRELIELLKQNVKKERKDLEYYRERLEEALASNQSPEEIEKLKKKLEEVKGNLFENVIKTKYSNIFSGELTAEKVLEVFEGTRCIDSKPQNLSKIKHALELILETGFDKEMKVALYMHEMFNDMALLIDVDYTAIIMLYSKMYEGILKKLHLPMYKAILPQSKISAGDYTFADATSNDVTIGSFRIPLTKEKNELKNLKDAAKSIDTIWDEHKSCIIWMNEIRNKVMHPQDTDISSDGTIEEQVLKMSPQQRLEKLLLLLFDKNGITSMVKIRDAFELQKKDKRMLPGNREALWVKETRDAVDNIIESVIKSNNTFVYSEAEKHYYLSDWTNKQYENSEGYLFVKNFKLQGKTELFSVLAKTYFVSLGSGNYKTAVISMGLYTEDATKEPLYYSLMNAEKISEAKEALKARWNRYVSEEDVCHTETVADSTSTYETEAVTITTESTDVADEAIASETDNPTTEQNRVNEVPQETLEDLIGQEVVFTMTNKKNNKREGTKIFVRGSIIVNEETKDAIIQPMSGNDVDKRFPKDGQRAWVKILSQEQVTNGQDKVINRYTVRYLKKYE